MKTLPLLAAAATLAACSTMSTPPAPASVTSRPFGESRSGMPATLWTLRAGHVEVDVTDRGATLVALRMPDRYRRVRDVVLGFDDVSGYESADNQYFGCTTGRVCNRIANGEFTLDGYRYILAKNNGPNHLHGGARRSLDKVHWQGEALQRDGAVGVRFTYTSPDGEEGYPGNLRIAASYWLSADGAELQFVYEATSDMRTPVNLTNHTYWNLGGDGSGAILGHELQVNAEHYTPTDDTLIPTGKLAPVVGTPLDFRKPTAIGQRIDLLTETAAKGYDHNFVLGAADADGRRHAATLRDPANGRRIEIWTTEPGLQVYSGNFLVGQTGKGGRKYGHRGGLCLETQHFPDSVNQPTFPSTIIAPGQPYRSSTWVRLGTDV